MWPVAATENCVIYLCVGHTPVSPTNAAEPQVSWLLQIHVGPRNRVLDGWSRSPIAKQHFECVQPVEKHCKAYDLGGVV